MTEHRPITPTTRQEIIDRISILLCMEGNKTIVIYASTVREGEAFFEEIAKRIPHYVGLQRTGLGRFKTTSKIRIHCVANINNTRGYGITMLCLLSSTSEKDKKELVENLWPVMARVSYRAMLEEIE